MASETTSDTTSEKKSGTTITLIVLLIIAVIIIVIFIILAIYLSIRGGDPCKNIYKLDMYQNPFAYYNVNWPYYSTGTTCESFTDATKWVEFELTNNSNTTMQFFSEMVSNTQDCATATSAVGTFNWATKGDGVTYKSGCVFSNPAGFLSLFVDQFINITIQTGDFVPISYQDAPGVTSAVKLSGIDPTKQKLIINASGSGSVSDAYVVNINIVSK